MMEEKPGRLRRSTDAWRLKPVVIAFIVLTLLFLAVLIGFAVVVTDVKTNSNQIRTLVISNNNLIKEIQKSRIESCQRTYEGVREVFRPLFPPPPRTKEQSRSLKLFNETIDDLKQGCITQTDPNKGG